MKRHKVGMNLHSAPEQQFGKFSKPRTHERQVFHHLNGTKKNGLPVAEQLRKPIFEYELSLISCSSAYFIANCFFALWVYDNLFSKQT